MSKIVGDIAVEVSADIAPLQRGMRQARGDVTRFGRESEQMAKRAARASIALTAAFAAAAAGGLALANQVGQLGERLTNLSRVAGTTPEKFQEWAAASRSVGIEQEKLSDILKDVQDRVGDFLQTGGGPMADFFENIAPKVGVTAEQFARLSGPEALQLYVNSLEKANLTQSEMTFYMEAVASDLTLMLPLLRDNGKEMDRLANEARDAGTILSNETVQGANDLNQKLRSLRDEVRGELIPALISVEDELAVLAQFVEDYGIPALTGLIELAAGAAEKFRALAGWIQSLGGNPRFFDDQGNEYDQYNNIIASPNMTIGDPLSDNGSLLPPPPGGYPEPPGTPVRRGGSRSGSKSGPTEEDFERLRDQFATEQEIIQENYERQLEQLQEFRDRKLATEEEFNQLEERIEKQHKSKMLDLEYRHRAEKLQAVIGGGQAILNELGAFNAQALKGAQIVGAGQALISTYIGAAKELEKGTLGFATAAAVIAKGIAFVGAIKGVSASTGGGGGVVGGGAGAGSAGPVATQEPRVSREVVLQLNGSRFSREDVISLMEQFNEYIEDGGNIRVVG